ncbi:cellulose/xylan binding protein with CBM9 domain [Larkinella arboricola]|uniref:Cellulose/xylan binding protein with CBM9 domain n=1 Tax=Larkinella arboricola TaxID=643671 RepID=A0A327XEV6_LARAB|nr:carbohydrate-binding family 9-like protein [Larkinella arboricola]RAK02756.1 cellulose/xylan binding protein with CBM9 domain [Larkinella arboricola]
MKKYRPVGLPSFFVLALGLLFFQGSSLRTDFGETGQPADDERNAGKVGIGRPAAGDTAQWAFPCDRKTIERYTAYRTTKPPVIDGKLDEEMWTKIPRSPRFVDLVSGNKTIHDTRAAVCWDNDNLYIAFWVEEPFINAKLTNHNDPIYTDNDVEVFVAGKDTYYEFEINSFGTLYEAFFIWKDAYEKGGFDKNPLFALANPKVKPFNGVGFKNHPRGLRYGSWDFRFPGLQSAVHIDGTINNNQDRDRRWTVELAFPWKGMEWIARADNRALPPRNNDRWRIDFSRFNTYKEAAPSDDHGGWAWNSHRVWDSHVPECFPIITFSNKTL